jgi:Ca-activated chloride channel family protein
MIEWGAPWAFLLLIPVALLPAQPWLTGRNRLAVPSLDAATHRWTLRRLVAWAPRVLQMAGLTLLVIALARPRITRRDVYVESDGLDILLTVDTSGSMDTDDFAMAIRRVTRMEAAKGVMDAFIEARPYDRIGVVVFGEEAYTLVPLTLDHDSLRAGLGTVDVGIAGNKTAIGLGLAVAARRMKQIDAKERVVILLTDGQSNSGPDPMATARAAAALGIRVYTIGVGGGGGIFDSGVDERGLTALAETTGGRYFRARNTEALREVFATIDELETSPAQVREVVEHDERFRDYLAPGFALLAMQALLSATWLRRGP